MKIFIHQEMALRIKKNTKSVSTVSYPNSTGPSRVTVGSDHENGAVDIILL